MRRRRWRTAVLRGGYTSCVLISMAFVVSMWWFVVLSVPTPIGPTIAISGGAFRVYLDDDRSCPPGRVLPPLFINFFPTGPILDWWNQWSMGSRYIYVPLYTLFVALLLPTLLVWRFVPKFPRGHCRRCGYDLTGLTEARCPECGTGFSEASA